MPAIYSVAAGTDSQANSDLYSFKIDPKSGHLQMMNKVDSGGRDATALDLDVPTQTLFAAHYASGSLSAVPIQSNAELGPVAATQTETGSGPSPRQKSAHAHGVAIAPGHNYALVTDLGADRVFIYRFDPTTRSLSPAANAAQEVAAGSGPRHLVFHPNGKFVFIDTELTAELRSYRWDGKAGRLTPVQVIQAYPAGQSGEKSAAELAVSKDGRFAYLSLRGDQDSIVVYAIDTRRGTLTEIQRISSQGRVPWSFGIDPSGRWMLVTNEGSNSVVVLKVDSSTGRLSVTGESATVPKPVTVTFYEPFK
jgi:6-phosphogluconolactonase